MNPTLRARLTCWIDAGRRVAAASLVESAGSTPHALGLALLVNDRGDVAGAISGGCVDGVVIEAADETLLTGRPRALAFGADGGLFGHPGLVCGGTLRVWIYELPAVVARALLSGTADLTLRGLPDVGPEHVEATASTAPEDAPRIRTATLPTGECEFRERFGERDTVLIIGQSGFTDALVRMARLLGREVIVCEPRRRFAAAVADADLVLHDQPDQCVQKLEADGRLSPRSAIIVCTHDRKFDEPALLAAVRSSAGFIGAMGSRKTTAERRARLAALGVTNSELARIHAPLGLDLGGETPAETALSVFAEILLETKGRTGQPLGELDGSIHCCHAG
jgi:xanthine dehydrogenase accessory factor